MTASEPEISADELLREASELTLAAARRDADAAAGRPWPVERDRAYLRRAVDHAERMQAASPGAVDRHTLARLRTELARLPEG